MSAEATLWYPYWFLQLILVTFYIVTPDSICLSLSLSLFFFFVGGFLTSSQGPLGQAAVLHAVPDLDILLQLPDAIE